MTRAVFIALAITLAAVGSYAAVSTEARFKVEDRV